MNNKKIVVLSISIVLTFFSCQEKKKGQNSSLEKENVQRELSFQSKKITNQAKYWWAITVGDLTKDGFADLVFINNNANGGYLGYYEGRKDSIWALHKIAETPPTGGNFASGDLELGDMDGDGDLDVLAVKHTGEWDDAGAEAEIFWYKNPEWTAQRIGTAPDAVKDLSLADFNNDGRLDLAILTFDEHSLSVYQQNEDQSFTRVVYRNVDNLHEGMDVGDGNADGLIDIFANGYLFINPGNDLTQEWPIEIIDNKWHNQTGDWSQNATKHFTADIDNDGIDEVFISHSERSGYPLSWYKKTGEKWVETKITDSISSCHTLQVFDFDLDGDLDVLAGVNKGRAVNLNETEFPVIIFINDGTYKNWTQKIINNDGIYNGRVIDFEGDGDYDIFRLPDHEATQMFLLENKIK